MKTFGDENHSGFRWCAAFGLSQKEKISMMKKVVLSLTLLVLCFLCLHIQVLTAWSAWEPADGYGGLNVDSGEYAMFPAIAIYNGTPYVAWEEYNASSICQIYVKYYSGGSWLPTDGYGGLNVDPGQRARDPAIAIYNGTPYVAWLEYNASGIDQIYVKYYSGGSWLPTDGYGGLNVDSDQYAYNSAIAMDNGTPYVTWREHNAPAIYQIYVKYYSGSSWLPTDGYGGLNVDPGQAARDPAIAIYNGTPYVVWREHNASVIYQIYVKYYSGGSWLPTNGYGGLNVSGQSTYAPAIAMDNGTPYVTWQERNASGIYQIYVKYYSGGSWLPTDGYGGLNVDPGQRARDPAIAIYNGTPYVAWLEYNASGIDQIYVKYYSGGSWLPTNGYGGLNVDPGQHADDPSIAIDNGTPYVTWHESNGDKYQIYVKYYVPITPTFTSTPTATPPGTTTPTSGPTLTITPTPTITLTMTVTPSSTITIAPARRIMTTTPYIIEREKVIAYPSPAKGDDLWFYYYVEGGAQVRIEIYNVIGERGMVLEDSHTGSEYCRTHWDIRNVAGGTYFYRMRIKSPAGTRDYGIQKLLIIK